jgi:hypothetical protein
MVKNCLRGSLDAVSSAGLVGSSGDPRFDAAAFNS